MSAEEPSHSAGEGAPAGSAWRPPDERRGRIRRAIESTLLIREGEGAAFLLSAAYFFLVLSAWYVIRPIREEMGLAGGVRNLPWLMTATLVAMLVVNPIYAWVVARLPRRRFVPLVYRFFALNLLLFLLLIWLGPPTWSLWIGRIFYVWSSVFNLFVVSVFWSVMVDAHSAGQAKRLFGAIGVGGTLGAIVGGTATAWLVAFTGPLPLILLSVVLLECAVRVFRGIALRQGLESAGRAEPGHDPIAGFKLLIRSPYLIGIALYLLLFTMTGTQLYMAQMEIVDATIPAREDRTRFFAIVDIATNGLTLVFQAFATGRFLLMAGLAAALVVVPLLTLGGFGALLAAPSIAVVAAFQVLRRAMHFAVDRPAREALFTPLSADAKYKTKAFLDTFVYRAGDAAGAWTKSLVGLVTPLAAAPTLVAMALSVLWLGTGVALGAGFRRRAAEGSSGAVAEGRRERP
ncbi:MAG TPA: hypothetical protein PKC43_08785 [Phycisphaerales bacterium]|nr:hypothetical protein [Phycisphaerales bacterium]HMP37531.1 hypothetical protein [Phycisphaerales bacterium]